MDNFFVLAAKYLGVEIIIETTGVTLKEVADCRVKALN